MTLRLTPSLRDREIEEEENGRGRSRRNGGGGVFRVEEEHAITV